MHLCAGKSGARLRAQSLWLQAARPGDQVPRALLPSAADGERGGGGAVGPSISRAHGIRGPHLPTACANPTSPALPACAGRADGAQDIVLVDANTGARLGTLEVREAP